MTEAYLQAGIDDLSTKRTLTHGQLKADLISPDGIYSYHLTASHGAGYNGPVTITICDRTGAYDIPPLIIPAGQCGDYDIQVGTGLIHLVVRHDGINQTIEAVPR